jgi:hypothetical protein
MVRTIATIGPLGRLPLGGALAAATGLALAATIWLLTERLAFVLAGWCFCFALAAWALPRALAAPDIPDDHIVVDRLAGIWLAAAPAIPLLSLVAATGRPWAAVALAAPLALYHLLLQGPLARMGRSARVWPRIGDDLISATVTMAATMLAMGLILMRISG